MGEEILELVSRSPEETRHIGLHLGQLACPGDVYLLVGNLGTGKTTLTQGIAWGLGAEGYAASPSFVLVREMPGRLPLYHMDLYRLDNIDEIADLGLDEYLYGEGVSVVEWAEKGAGLLPADHMLVRIEYAGDDERKLCFQPRGTRYRGLVEQLRRALGAG